VSAFSLVVDNLFADHNLGEDAVWQSGGVGGVACRVIRKSPDQVANFGVSRALLASCVLDVRVSDIAAPAENDTVVIGALTFKIIADPALDTLGLVHSCEAVKV
jgi:hypothetical protein